MSLRRNGLGAAALSLAACGGGGGGPPRAGQLAEQPSVLLITVDTLRRDHLGLYGYHRDTTPRLDELAAEGIVFERAVAPMASTLPSHTSILTGLYTHQHGLLSNAIAGSMPFEPSPGRESIAQYMERAGWRTAAVVSAAPVSNWSGLDVGFETFVEPWAYGKKTFLAEEATDAALAWLRTYGDAPFFLWLHLWDTHEPNEPPEPYASAFTTDEAQERWFDERGIVPENVRSTSARLFFPGLAEGEGRNLRLDRAAILDLVNRYDGDLAYVDAQVGRLLDVLDELELSERTIVAFTADHGQALGENDRLGHGEIVDVNVFVPLILRLPEDVFDAPRRVEEIVSLVDLMPTVLGRFGVPEGARAPDATGPDARELLPYLEQVSGEDLFSGDFRRPFTLTQRTDRNKRLREEQGHKYALYSEHWKYVHYTSAPDELYDLDADPGETTDVIAAHADVAGVLLGRVESLLAERPADAPTGAPRPGSEAFLEALEELGYGGQDGE